MPVRPNKDWKYVGSDYCQKPDIETLAYFARNDAAFRAACSGAGVLPTKDMARRWKQKKGKAFRYFEEKRNAGR